MRAWTPAATWFLLVSKVRLRCIRMLLHTQRFHTIEAEFLLILLTIGHSINPTLQPRVTLSSRFSVLVVLAKEIIVAAVIALDRRRMRAIRTFNHRIHQETRN